MTHPLVFQFTVRCFVNFCQVFAGIFWVLGRTVGFDCIDPDHCLSLYFD